MKCELFFSYEKNIDFENIKKHLEGFPEQNQIITDNNNLWDWNNLSSHPNVTWEFIKQHIDLNWNWYLMLFNPNITLEIIESNPSIPWNLNGVLCNPNIKSIDDTNNIEKPKRNAKILGPASIRFIGNPKIFVKKEATLPNGLYLILVALNKKSIVKAYKNNGLLK